MLDTAREIPTPEGIELTLRLAGPVARALAWGIDLLLRLAAFALLACVPKQEQKPTNTTRLR